MKLRLIISFIACVLFFSCSGKKVYGETNSELQIIRFDQQLYQYLTQEKELDSLLMDTAFLNVFGEKIIHIGQLDSVGFYERLQSFFSEPTLLGMYKDEQEKLDDLTEIDQELALGMDILLTEFPSLKQPQIYMHVSGFGQNVIVTDEILSLSADKYLGADYPLYQSFFYDYQRQSMTPARIVPDYLLGFMMANFPFVGREDVLLDRILHEGKLRYILSLLLPERKKWESVAYTQEQYEWCEKNESRIWKTILENNHLFSSNHSATARYLVDAPHTAFLPAESPGRVGIWVGYQIITAYMQNNPDTSLQELMENIDYQSILKQSKYK